MSKKTAFITVVFVVLIIAQGTKLVHPAPLQIFVENETTILNQVPRLFSFADVLVMIIAVTLLNLSRAYLLFFDSAPQTTSVGSTVLEERKKRWESIAKTLKEDEQKIYSAIIEEGIIAQSEIVEKTGLPKSNVSRALYVLESRGLIERRRRGMGNIILLK